MTLLGITRMNDDAGFYEALTTAGGEAIATMLADNHKA